MEENHPSVEHEDNQVPQAQLVRQRATTPYAIPFSIVLAGVIVAGAIMFTNRNGAVAPVKEVAQAGNAVPAAADLKALAADTRVLGDPNAPVTIIEFADFQCPFCGRFFSTTAKEIIEKYVKTGKAKFVYHDFAFLGEESSWAAEAAHCAGDQGKYWQYHDYLYEHQKGENDGAFSKANLKGFAVAIGLKSGDFNTCLDSGKHAKDVANDTEMGRKLGVTGTPTSFVNGKLVQGAVPFSQFEPTILEALKGK